MYITGAYPQNLGALDQARLPRQTAPVTVAALWLDDDLADVFSGVEILESLDRIIERKDFLVNDIIKMNLLLLQKVIDCLKVSF